MTLAPASGSAGDPRRIVVGVGGRALGGDDGGSALPPPAALGWVVDLVAAGFRVVVAPPVARGLSDQLRRAERALPDLSPDPLDISLAQAQGATGYGFQQVLDRLLRARDLPVSTVMVLVRVAVDADDPAFRHPSVPVGPLYPSGRARQLARGRGWVIREVAAGRVQRVVPAPEPRRVLDGLRLDGLLDAGATVVAPAGAIPVVETEEGWHGVEALLQPDLVAALLATTLGAGRLVLLTDVAQLAVGHGTARAIGIERLTPVETRALQASGEFPAGTMGAKVEAAVRFVEAGGPEALITSPAALAAALDGSAGTRIAP